MVLPEWGRDWDGVAAAPCSSGQTGDSRPPVVLPEWGRDWDGVAAAPCSSGQTGDSRPPMVVRGGLSHSGGMGVFFSGRGGGGPAVQNFGGAAHN